MPVKKNFSVSVGIGAPSLITIFLVLSLVSFSVLSYMTSNADYRFSKNLEERVTSYYAACNISEEKIAEIETALTAVYQNSTEQTYFDNAKKALSEYSISAENILTFRTQVRDSQDLQVSLRLQYPQSPEDPLYIISEWLLIQTGEWVPDNSLNLLEGPDGNGIQTDTAKSS